MRILILCFCGLDDVAYLYLDIEYWAYETVEKLIKQMENKIFMDDKSLKMLLRLSTGKCLKKGEYNIDFKEMKKKLENYIENRFSIMSDGALHDCVNLYENKDYYGELLCGREALNNAVSAYKAKMGVANMNVHK